MAIVIALAVLSLLSLGMAHAHADDLSQGSQGGDVTALQTQLAADGYDVSVDGDYGPQTAAAVAQYQQDHGLSSDGVAGPDTMGSLNGTAPAAPADAAPPVLNDSYALMTPVQPIDYVQPIAEQPAPSVDCNPSSYSSGGNLSCGSSSGEVRQVQQALADKGYDVAVDGSYGPQTAAAVAKYQQDQHDPNFAVDGVVGPQTWGALVGGDLPAPAPSAAPDRAPAAAGGGGFVEPAPGSKEACIINAESGGNPQITNSSGYWGLYQFGYSTWTGYGGNADTFGNASAGEQQQMFNSAVSQRGNYLDWTPYDGC